MSSAFLLALLGGALIGIAATLYLLLPGRISGISGIFANSIDPALSWRDRLDRIWFILGLVLVGLPLYHWMPDHFQSRPASSPLLIVAAGLLVGVGTRLGSGCTSGHGVCGISRGSPRSGIATLVFITTGAVTVFVLRQLGALS